MGLHGSSTTALILQDVKVPAENVLGEVGKGHKVAFNVLNFARFKLGAMCGGGAHGAIGESGEVRRDRAGSSASRSRRSARSSTSSARWSSRTYAIESLLYRTAGLIDDRIAATPHARPTDRPRWRRSRSIAVEASIAKVAGSEALNYVLDENIQIHGGNGYVHDYPAERHYRDARVNRIFEGTNEINRLLIPGMLIRRAVKGDLALIAAAKALQDELLGPPSMPAQDEGVLADERRAVDAFKKTALMVFGLAMQTYGEKLTDEQEVLMHLADIADRRLQRRKRDAARAGSGRERRRTGARLHADAARVFVNDAAMRIEASARQALAAMVDGDTLRTMLAALRRVLKVTPVNTVVAAAPPRRRDRLARRLSVRVEARMGGMGWMGRMGERGLEGGMATGGCDAAADLFRALCPPFPPVLPSSRSWFSQRVRGRLHPRSARRARLRDQDCGGACGEGRGVREKRRPDSHGQTRQFLPLAYFPIDPDYNVPGTLRPIDDKTHLSRCRPPPAPPARCGASARSRSRSKVRR